MFAIILYQSSTPDNNFNAFLRREVRAEWTKGGNPFNVGAGCLSARQRGKWASGLPALQEKLFKLILTYEEKGGKAALGVSLYIYTHNPPLQVHFHSCLDICL